MPKDKEIKATEYMLAMEFAVNQLATEVTKMINKKIRFDRRYVFHAIFELRQCVREWRADYGADFPLDEIRKHG